jgi:hypothetical protein
MGLASLSFLLLWVPWGQLLAFFGPGGYTTQGVGGGGKGKKAEGRGAEGIDKAIPKTISTPFAKKTRRPKKRE